tara:strand:+ start:10223 stop:11611 length:1389 start_codon:yes stop_codon:yes gene_type:complete
MILGITIAINLLLASATGCVLGLYTSSQNIVDVPRVESHHSFETLISVFEGKYPAVYEIRKDDYRRLYASVENDKGDMLKGYFDPSNADYFGPIIREPQWIKWITTLHRSLLVGTAGRYIMLLTTLLTVFLTLFGVVLWFNKYSSSRSIKRIWRSEKKHKELHSHGGLVATPAIILLLLSAMFLSFKSLQIIDFTSSTSSDVGELKVENLGQFKQVIFPFFPGEPYELQTSLGSYSLTLKPFEILSHTANSNATIWHTNSMFIHTGRGNLGLSFSWIGIALLLLYFTYTGIRISAWRFKGIKILSPKPHPVRILYASESGKTMAVAYSFQKQLRNEGIKSGVSSINGFEYKDGIEQLFIFVATYGDGEAPSNGSKWQSAMNSIPKDTSVRFSVLGFGSMFYPKYCKFGEDIDELLKEKLGLTRIIPIHKVNQQSISDYKEYVLSLFQTLNLSMPEKLEWPES